MSSIISQRVGKVCLRVTGTGWRKINYSPFARQATTLDLHGLGQQDCVGWPQFQNVETVYVRKCNPDFVNRYVGKISELRFPKLKRIVVDGYIEHYQDILPIWNSKLSSVEYTNSSDLAEVYDKIIENGVCKSITSSDIVNELNECQYDTVVIY